MVAICIRADSAYVASKHHRQLLLPLTERLINVELTRPLDPTPEAESSQLLKDEQMQACLVRIFHQCQLLTRSPANPAELFDAATESHPVCIAIGLRFDRSAGLDVAVECHKRWPHTAVVLVSRQTTIEIAVEAMRQGLDGVLPIPTSPTHVQREICAAMERSKARRRGMDEATMARARLDRLSPRQLEVLELIVAGASNKQVATRMNLGLRTIEKYRHQSFDLLGVETVAEAACLWTTAHREE